MRVVSHDDVHEFWRLAGPLYSADPVRHTAAVSVLARLRRGTGFSDHPPQLLTVHDDESGSGGSIIGAVYRTPPYPLGVSALPVEAAGAVAEFLRAEHLQPGGASGDRARVEAFAAAWRRVAGVGHSIVMDLRLYRLAEAELAPPTNVPGELTFADERDFDLLVSLRRGFVQDTQHRAEMEYLEEAVRGSLAAGSVHGIWRFDGKPVSVALAGAPANGMSRVGMVYTPPEERGHGYASAVTAAISQWALDQGASDVVLFTDLANPISNSIYQRIGYRPVLDALEVAFPPEPTPIP
ncbi:MAG TPA: GNAT family N-acetyltransferase [Pseudonocardiaceae bacterium]|jgi:GNAT superfamily N-acetyltransferase|nr:GNAT family N-acetyltransferase [Pseudonocardiaceae bacterium]